MSMQTMLLLRFIGSLTLAAALLAPADASAQVWIGSTAPRRGSVELTGAGLWSGGQTFADRDATLTPNPDTGSTSFVLFETESALRPAFGAQGSVGVYLGSRVSIEGGVRYVRPRLETRLTNDVEDAPDVTAVTTLTQYLFSGSLLYHFVGRGSVVPFIGGGAGHVRDVHAGNELVETGTEYHGTAGVKMWFGSGRRRVGLRAEGGVSVIDGGFSFEEGRRTAPTAAIGLSYLF